LEAEDIEIEVNDLDFDEVLPNQVPRKKPIETVAKMIQKLLQEEDKKKIGEEGKRPKELQEGQRSFQKLV